MDQGKVVVPGSWGGGGWCQGDWEEIRTWRGGAINIALGLSKGPSWLSIALTGNSLHIPSGHVHLCEGSA